MATQKSRRSNIRLFIGSSSESKEIAENIQAALDTECESTVWDQHAIALSSVTLPALIKATQEFDFAILVYAPDDIVRKRGAVKWAPRDNVIFESGLFIAALGSERTFLVSCEGGKLSLPSDLSGITMAPIQRNRMDGNLRAAVNPAVVKIRESIRKVGPRNGKLSPPESHGLERAFKHQADSVRDLSTGIAGVKVICKDGAALERWGKNVLGMLWDSFELRQNDLYAAWLRPVGTSKTLKVFWEKNLKKIDSHHPFKLGEGLVGKVWQEGCSASTSPMRNHKWWLYRKGCENMSYICACVGVAGGEGGVLAIGSDAGFDIYPGDEARVEAFAALLAIAAPQIPPSRKQRKS